MHIRKRTNIVAMFFVSISLLAVDAQAQRRTLMDFLFGDDEEQQRYNPYEDRYEYGNSDPYGTQKPPQQQQQPLPQVNAGGRYAHLAGWGHWPLKKTQWDWQDEDGYSAFVQALGRSGCTTVDSCIRGEANPYRFTDPSKDEFRFWSDCADWPYFLRSYYAWKNGLPFVFSSGMSALPLTPEQKAAVASGEEKPQSDVRYSWNGNKPSQFNLIPDIVNGTNYFDVHTRIQNSVHTATYRVDPRTNHGEMYSPAIQLGSIRPGTAVYDPQGHVGVVYDITADGQVMVFDALVDTKSVSPRRPYSSDFYKRSKIAHGAWFQNFRPVQIVGASYDPYTSTYRGGQAFIAANEQIPYYSLEMFGNTTNADGTSAYLVDTAQGPKVVSTFQEFLRRRMFEGQYKLDVLTEFKTRMKTICEDFGSRVSLVQDATKKGIASQPHVATLPNTIYGGSGDWDVFSTPGGDVRRRNSANSALQSARELKQAVESGSGDYSYTGQNLKADLIRVATETLNSCSVSYTNTAGQPVSLTLASLLTRMPLMSFSPYHCVELRWGATSQQELASCPDLRDQTKMRWYKAQQTLRNQMVRDTNIFTGYSLQELEVKASTLGPAQPQNYNLIERMNSEL